MPVQEVFAKQRVRGCKFSRIKERGSPKITQSFDHGHKAAHQKKGSLGEIDPLNLSNLNVENNYYVKKSEEIRKFRWDQSSEDKFTSIKKKAQVSKNLKKAQIQL